MTTTALIVEFVIIGFQALVWILLIILTIFGYEWIDLPKIKEWTIPISLALIALSYTLGLISNVYAWLILERFLPNTYKLKTTSVAIITIKYPDVLDYFERKINQVRLLRATSLNLLLISLCWLIFIIRYKFLSGKFVFTLLCLAIVTILSFIGWIILSRFCRLELDQAERVASQG